MPPTMTRPPAQGQRAQAPALPPIPFTAAAHEHTEPMNTTISAVLGAAQQQVGPLDVPAYGFLRNIFLEVTMAGGTLGAGALSADYPFNILQNITLSDVNGAPIFGPLDGFAALQSNIYGGYAFRQDPRLGPWYDGTINGKFYLRIPVEISRHNAYGALANQNAAASYKLSFSFATSTQAFATAPTTAPVVTVKSWLEAWSQPNATDLTGRPQQREPVAHGTTQFWSAFTRSGLGAGAQNIILPRMGNLIRTLIVITRDAAGARQDTVMPDPIFINWDARQLNNESQRYRQQKTMEAIEAPSVRDTGVHAYLFNNSTIGRAGDEDPNLWLPTVQSTRLEIAGTNTVAGGFQVVTCDIAPAEVRPDERFVENSATGFHPVGGAF